jgi:malate dehydrogenase (oxaloacetate-decarboxylating)
VPDNALREEFILPSPLDRTVAPQVATAVAEAARKENIARA